VGKGGAKPVIGQAVRVELAEGSEDAAAKAYFSG
jgi:hypothetical protein